MTKTVDVRSVMSILRELKVISWNDEDSLIIHPNQLVRCSLKQQMISHSWRKALLTPVLILVLLLKMVLNEALLQQLTSEETISMDHVFGGTEWSLIRVGAYFVLLLGGAIVFYRAALLLLNRFIWRPLLLSMFEEALNAETRGGNRTASLTSSSIHPITKRRFRRGRTMLFWTSMFFTYLFLSVIPLALVYPSLVLKTFTVVSTSKNLPSFRETIVTLLFTDMFLMILLYESILRPTLLAAKRKMSLCEEIVIDSRRELMRIVKRRWPLTKKERILSFNSIQGLILSFYLESFPKKNQLQSPSRLVAALHVSYRSHCLSPTSTSGSNKFRQLDMLGTKLSPLVAIALSIVILRFTGWNLYLQPSINKKHPTLVPQDDQAAVLTALASLSVQEMKPSQVIFDNSSHMPPRQKVMVHDVLIRALGLLKPSTKATQIIFTSNSSIEVEQDKVALVFRNWFISRAVNRVVLMMLTLPSTLIAFHVILGISGLQSPRWSYFIIAIVAAILSCLFAIKAIQSIPMDSRQPVESVRCYIRGGSMKPFMINLGNVWRNQLFSFLAQGTFAICLSILLISVPFPNLVTFSLGSEGMNRLAIINDVNPPILNVAIIIAISLYALAHARYLAWSYVYLHGGRSLGVLAWTSHVFFVFMLVLPTTVTSLLPYNMNGITLLMIPLFLIGTAIGFWPILRVHDELFQGAASTAEWMNLFAKNRS